MSNYNTVEAAVLTLIQAISTVSSDDITRGDYSVMDSGRDNIAVITPGAIDQPDARSRMSYYEWDVLIDVIRRYIDDGSTSVSFIQWRDSIMTQLESYPTLDGVTGVLRTRIRTEGDPDDIFDDDDAGPFFKVQRLRLTITQRIDLTGGEYA
jgi:hypothetical protein